MSDETLFPPGFFFGSSTASHQVEGGNVNNDWWDWEHRGDSTAVEPSGDAIDQYHRFEEDFGLLAQLGQNAHRLSLEWSRIEPALEPARVADAACVALCDELREEMVDVYLDGLQGDFVGVQYYTRMRVESGATTRFGTAPAGAPLTQMGWELHPEGLHAAITRAASTGLPVVVTENGIATADDAERIAYLRTHLEQVVRALADDVDVRGYLYWSSFDNFEWAVGYRPTFGLIGIDRLDGLRRIVRPSAHAFAEVARTGRLDGLSAG